VVAVLAPAAGASASAQPASAGARPASMISDDNFSATQFTRVLNLAVKLP
jgi:hypothetical protein